MKLTIDLEQIYTGADWGETVGELIRSEVLHAIRTMVKAEFKAHDKHIKAAVAAAVNEAMKELKTQKVRDIAAKMVASL